MAVDSVTQNPYANAHTASDMRKVSENLMKEHQKANTPNKKKQATNTSDYSINISAKAKQKASSTKENPYAKAHSASEMRNVSDNLMKSYKNSASNQNTAAKMK